MRLAHGSHVAMCVDLGAGSAHCRDIGTTATSPPSPIHRSAIMAKASQIKADWQTIDPETLPAPIAKQYARYKDAYREMKAEREAFEGAMREMAKAPVGSRLVFGYNFGKLSVALVPDDAKPAPAKGALALGDWLKAQGSRRV